MYDRKCMVHDVTRRIENCASCSLGVHMYDRKAELIHLPSVRIVKSSIPALAADVAAPIMKLCPQNSDKAILLTRELP